jgi:hypothetical protein
MPSIEYVSWDGGISQDDYIAPKGSYIEWNNVTWLRTGYGITLWPKNTKQLLTNTAPRVIAWDQFFNWDLDEIFAWGDDWEIYKLGWTGAAADNTPNYTMSNGYHVVNWFSTSAFKYFITKQNTTSTTCEIARISEANYNSDSFAWNVAETFESVSNFYTPPVLKTGSFAYVGWNGTIHKLDLSTDTFASSAIFDEYVTGITQHGTTIVVYQNTRDGWVASYWDGVSASLSANNIMWFRPMLVVQKWGIDYITAEDGSLWVWSWYEFQKISEAQQSSRLNDNSQFQDKLKFTNSWIYGQNMDLSKWDLILGSQDSTAWSYIYKELQPWMPPFFNKAFTYNYNDVAYDNIYTVKTLDRWSNNALYMGWWAGAAFWIDVFDKATNDTAKDWYLITNVFRWPPDKMNKIKEIRITTSDTDGTWDFIKLYKRIDDWSWTLFRTINNSTSTIERQRITTETDEFVDIQFKAEFSNALKDSTPPILHSMELIYTVNKD